MYPYWFFWISVLLDTVDHDILLSILANRFSIQGLALDWFRSYLSNRTQPFAGFAADY